MKKSDIFEIAIKILGLYLLVTVIGSLRDILAYLTIVSEQKQNSQDNFNQTPFLLISIFYFIFVLTFAFVFTFKTKAVVKEVCSPTDFEETAKLFADRKVIYEIAIVLTGLLLIIWTLPDFAFRLVGYFQLLHSGAPTRAYDNNFLITSAIKIIVGLVLVFKGKFLSTILSVNKKEV